MTAMTQTGLTLSPPSDVNGNTNKLRKYIIFKLLGYSFALPSENILKIVATPPPNQGGMVSMGLVQLGQYSIRILNLLKTLDLKNNIESSEQDSDSNEPTAVTSTQNLPFLIVLRNANETLWGVAVSEPPDLMEIHDQALNSVPLEQRAFGTLRGVSHIAQVGTLGDQRTILILDMTALFAQQQIDTPADDLFIGIEPPLKIEPPLEIEPPREVTNTNEDDGYIEDLLP